MTRRPATRPTSAGNVVDFPRPRKPDRSMCDLVASLPSDQCLTIGYNAAGLALRDRPKLTDELFNRHVAVAYFCLARLLIEAGRL